MQVDLAEGVVLRSLTVADAPAFAEHIASDLERLAEFLIWPERTADVEGAAAWVGRYAAGEGGRVLIAGIVERDRLLGGVVLFNHDSGFAIIELGCWVVAAGEGRGLVHAACLEALRVAVDLGVQRVVWECNPANTRSRRLAERLGFQVEGVLRSSYVVRGERQDTLLLSLVGTEISSAAS